MADAVSLYGSVEAVEALAPTAQTRSEWRDLDSVPYHIVGPHLLAVWLGSARALQNKAALSYYEVSQVAGLDENERSEFFDFVRRLAAVWHEGAVFRNHMRQALAEAERLAGERPGKARQGKPALRRVSAKPTDPKEPP